MHGRLLLAAFLLVASTAEWAGAQATTSTTSGIQRWNDRASLPDAEEPESPTVDLWIEGGRTFSYGEPVRVWFNVSDDAFVVVARVDANGHLTVLFPSSPTAYRDRWAIEGGRDILVRGRRGDASFYATDRMGGGFVFAIASYEPFSLAGLSIRDFDRYVTGMYVGRPAQVYIGDPHRIVDRFAKIVSFSASTPYDYAVDYYNVDAPYYVTSAGFQNYCSGYNGQYRRSLAEQWDDDLYYGPRNSAYYNCNVTPFCSGLSYGSYGFSYLLGPTGIPQGLCNYTGPRTNNPTTPPTGPASGDSLRVPPWLADSISGSHPDTVSVIADRRSEELSEGLNTLRRGTTGTEGRRGPIVIADDDPTERSYAIPGRALRNSPLTIGQGRDRTQPILDRPDRGSPAAADGGIQWVRPPREVVQGTRDAQDGFLPRSPRNRGERPDRAASPAGSGGTMATTFVNPTDRGRGDVLMQPPRYEPPTRNAGPRFDSPPPSVRQNDSGLRFTAPPPRNDFAPRFDSPRGNSSAGSSAGSSSGASGGASGGADRPAAGSDRPAASPASPSPPPSPASTGEKKPVP